MKKSKAKPQDKERDSDRFSMALDDIDDEDDDEEDDDLEFEVGEQVVPGSWPPSTLDGEVMQGNDGFADELREFVSSNAESQQEEDRKNPRSIWQRFFHCAVETF